MQHRSSMRRLFSYRIWSGTSRNRWLILAVLFAVRFVSVCRRANSFAARKHLHGQLGYQTRRAGAFFSSAMLMGPSLGLRG
jgi:hypothetical protein